jgi:hypothetical protein
MSPKNRIAAGVTVVALVLAQVALVLTGSQPVTLFTLPPWVDKVMLVVMLFLSVRIVLNENEHLRHRQTN